MEKFPKCTAPYTEILNIQRHFLTFPSLRFRRWLWEPGSESISGASCFSILSEKLNVASTRALSKSLCWAGAASRSICECSRCEPVLICTTSLLWVTWQFCHSSSPSDEWRFCKYGQMNARKHTRFLSRLTIVSLVFMTLILKPFWVKCLQMRNDLPVTDLFLLD